MKVIAAVSFASSALLLMAGGACLATQAATRLALGSAALLWLAGGIGITYIYYPLWDPALRRLRRRHRGEKIAVLTFDDGPDDETTPRILDTLRREGIRATFFVVGQKAGQAAGLLQRMVAEGHEVANHTASHRILVRASADEIRTEIEGCNEALQRSAGRRPSLFRAPHGFKTPRLMRMLRELDMRLVAWTKGIWDTDSSDAAQLLRRFRKHFSPLEILLLHDGRADASSSPERGKVVGLLGEVIREYRGRGYRFASIGELIGEGR